MFGKRRLLLVSLVLLVTGSVVCALSDSLIPMIAGRTLQGLAAAVVTTAASATSAGTDTAAEPAKASGATS